LEEEWINSVSINEEIVVKKDFQLHNFPNPFNPETTIFFNLSEVGKVELEIFNIRGQKVKQLVSNQLPAGQHSIVWDGIDDDGKHVSSGVYLYKLNVNNKTEAIRKCLLLK